MSPVQQSKERSPRSMVLAVAGIVLGLALVLGLFVVAIPSLTEEGTVQVTLGDDTFAPGSAENLSETIAGEGPLLFGDVSGRNDRDVYLQHIGEDPATGWYAFDAHRPGQPRDCFLEWRAEQNQFEDACDGAIVPADGGDQMAYPVTITEDGQVVIDLNPDDPATDTTAGG
jgi:hypothetical protein